MVSTLTFGSSPKPTSVGHWMFPEDYRWWLKLPEVATPKRFALKQRLIGPLEGRDGKTLGFLARVTYEWLWTDDPYFIRVDEELRAKGQ